MNNYKYCIGSLKFKTKIACETYTRNVINSLGICIIDKKHSEFNFFMDLICNHSEKLEKIGTGVCYFKIDKNKMNLKAYHTSIVRNDGSLIDFSWRHCCAFRAVEDYQNLQQAMRYAVKKTTLNYKRECNSEDDHLICNICKTTDEEWNNYHVDHMKPSFKTLTHTFLKTNTPPTMFDDHKIRFHAIFKYEDKKFNDNWKIYHDTHCNLQILCRTCNSTKKREM